MVSGTQGKAPVEVVEIDSSDDEEPVVPPAKGNNKVGTETAMQMKGPKVEVQMEVAQSSSDRQQLEFRSFWKAGATAIGPSTSTSFQGDLEHARVHPKFLHSNATSHKWAFGAIAELLDNAVDEICNGATFVKVDRMYNKKDNSPALFIQDDGGGMSPDSIRKCMSLGYSSKTSNTTIGQYGNGFKTSTMRLGADVIVFSRSSQSGHATQSVGLLSYTFLRRTGQDDVVVPMIDFDISGNWAEPIIYTSLDDWSENLKTILEWSPFSSKNDLMLQCEDIGSHGTKIIIYNLWLNDEGIYELNFDDDDEDIRLRDEANAGNLQKPNKRRLQLQSHISYRLRFSLRAYSSILYMRKLTNFKILLRGKPVEQLNFADELKYTKTFTYRPQLVAASTEVSVATTVGFIKEAPELGVCGFNVYHKNRLIRPFWKVTADGNSKGYGVVGILEANFIEPAHDKQDFERSSLFFKLETRLKQMINEYWRDHCHLVGRQPAGIRSSNVPSKSTVPSQVRQQQLSTGKNVNHTPVIDLSEADEVEDGIEGSTTDIGQLREENIQLVTRCEQYLQKENELLRTVEALEKQLAETKTKSAKLSLHIEAQKLKLNKQPMQQHKAF
ncbi:OLC1v1010954C1 [Oldenlandia corymbosa var. corymbosa]|uniref:OLC1v1010954C1 n=1 Tax=Oldenlandia corymbosa var. corymbosa TaxID=529605 RepID=A0AAV1DVZ5_OLDCO|nr:OLC1v1010954C1 [Oldenlandia corymbosa var. corymbosa]